MRFYVYPGARYFRSVKQLKRFIQQMLLFKDKDTELIIAVEVNGKIVKMYVFKNPYTALDFCDEIIMLSHVKTLDKVSKKS